MVWSRENSKAREGGPGLGAASQLYVEGSLRTGIRRRGSESHTHLGEEHCQPWNSRCKGPEVQDAPGISLSMPSELEAGARLVGAGRVSQTLFRTC